MSGPDPRIVAVVGPSGAGKDTLIRRAVARDPGVVAIRRVITRPADGGTEDFQPASPAAFERMRAEGRFVLDWQAHGLRYGITVPPEGARLCLVNLSRGVLAQAARVFAGLSVIHVDARPEVLAARLAARGRETPADIAARIARRAPFDPGELPVTHIDNSGDAEAAHAAFLAALNEVLV